jgi:hypothetical protein
MKDRIEKAVIRASSTGPKWKVLGSWADLSMVAMALVAVVLPYSVSLAIEEGAVAGLAMFVGTGSWLFIVHTAVINMDRTDASLDSGDGTHPL